MIFAFSEGEGHWIGPAAGLAVLLTGVFSIFQAVTLYFADCYETYSSSALAVQSLTRNLCGFSFPLFTTQMYNGLSYRWASFLAAMVALLLGFVPFWLFIYGPRESHSHPSCIVMDELEHGTIGPSKELQRELSRDTVAYEPSKKESLQSDKIYVVFEENDPEDPYNWSKLRKWIVLLGSCMVVFAPAAVCASFPMGEEDMERVIGNPRELGTLAYSIYFLGYALGPMFLAPLSETYGRFPLYIICSSLSAILQIPIAVSKSIAVIIVFRFLSALAGSTGSSMLGGTIADIFHYNERGYPMLTFAIVNFCSAGLFSTAMGFAASRQGYQFLAWMQFLVLALTPVIIGLCSGETRGSVLLSRRAAKLRKATGDNRYLCKADEERGSLKSLLALSLTRPTKMYFTEPVVDAYALYSAFAYALMYVCFESVSLVYETVYGFSIESVGLVFLAIPIAVVLASGIYMLQEHLYAKTVHKRGPEARLYIAMIGGVLMPIGLFIFGFAQGRGHWMGPAVGLCILYAGVVCIFVSSFLYMADAYGAYSSSAMAAMSLLRNVFCCAFPLFTRQMYNGMGYTWATFLLGCLSWLLALVPFLLFVYGRALRARSRYQ